MVTPITELTEQRTDPSAVASYRRDVAIREVSTLFLGDSITEGWQYGNGARYFRATFGPTASAFGVGGDHARHLLWRITEGRLLDGLDPAVIVLLIGANEMATDARADASIATVTVIVATLRATCPASRLVVLGVLPEILPGESGVLHRIGRTNARLKALTEAHGATFLDVSDAFRTQHGVRWRLLGDGRHPTTAGYRVLTRAVASVLGVPVRETPATGRERVREGLREVRGVLRGVEQRLRPLWALIGGSGSG